MKRFTEIVYNNRKDEVFPSDGLRVRVLRDFLYCTNQIQDISKYLIHIKVGELNEDEIFEEVSKCQRPDGQYCYKADFYDFLDLSKLKAAIKKDFRKITITVYEGGKDYTEVEIGELKFVDGNF